jgi:hypothetical protein
MSAQRTDRAVEHLAIKRHTKHEKLRSEVSRMPRLTKAALDRLLLNAVADGLGVRL